MHWYPPPHNTMDECSHRNTCSSLTLAGGKHCSGKSTAEMEEEDGFYQKLNKLNESSGLSLLFNFRDTSIDLHRFYKIVTESGGYHQVTKDGKWEVVASGLNQQNQVPLTPTQFQKLYATILYPFDEQTYQYQSSVKHNKAPITCNVTLGSRDFESKNVLVGHRSCPRAGNDFIGSTGKRKLDDRLYTTQCGYDHGSRKSSPVAMIEEKKPVSYTPPKVKEARKDPRVPRGSRNCYQMFIKIECDKLKKIHGETPSAHHRDMVVEAWRRLSDDDKQPYIEASKKDKERFAREMAAYEELVRTQHQSTTQKVIDFSSPTLIDFTKTSSGEAAGGSHTIPRQNAGNQKVVDSVKPQTDGDYHVSLQPDNDQEIARASNESMVEMTVGLMKNAQPNDPIFQINWNEYCGSSNI